LCSTPGCHVATFDDAAGLVALRIAVNQHLTEQYGPGCWAAGLTEMGALYAMRNSTVYVARRRKGLIGTLALSTTKPWAIDRTYFSASRRPLYLTAMEISPEVQRQGVGRLCLPEACRIAKQ
jgi:hypothetical protein